MSRTDYWKIAQIAQMLGVTERTVRNHISQGFYPAYRIPGARGVRLNPAEVRAALKLIPSTKARVGVGSFGPKAKIYDLPPQPVRVLAVDQEEDDQ